MLVRRQRAQGLRNLEFVVADLSNFDKTAEPEGFDFITTFDAVHDQAQPLSVLRGIHRALQAQWRLSDAGHQRDQATCTTTSNTRSAPFCIRSPACTV